MIQLAWFIGGKNYSSEFGLDRRCTSPHHTVGNGRGHVHKRDYVSSEEVLVEETINK